MGNLNSVGNIEPYVKWSDEEQAFLLANNKELTYVDIAKNLGRNYHSVLHQALKSGLIKKKQWSSEDIKLLREIYSHSSKEEILQKVNRTWGAIMKRSGELKIRRSLLPPLDKLPTFVLDEGSKIWLACAIDCEGSIGLGKAKGRFYNPSISIDNTNEDFLKHFRKLVTCTHKVISLDSKRYENRKNIYKFDMASMPWVYVLLTQIRPYFIIKGQQADLLIEFIEIIDEIKRNNDGRIVYPKRVHEIYDQLKKLNKKGKK